MDKLIKKAQRALDGRRYAEAQKILRKCIKNDPQSVDGHYLLGAAYAQAGAHAKALRCLETARALHPDSPWILSNLGGVRQLQGEHDKALALYRQALDLKPDLFEALTNCGVILQGRREFKEAISHFERSLSINPNQPVAAQGLGHCWLCLADYVRAEEQIRRAIEMTGGSPQLWDTLGHVFRKRGDLNAARDAYEHSLAGNPSNAVTRYLLASVSGENVQRPPLDYVREVFDEYAITFERDIQKLGYTLPNEIGRLLTESFHDRLPFGNALDLGCGTGMVGKAVAGHVERMLGVDISPEMLVRASASGRYDRLVESDLLQFLRETRESFDLVVAADVFLYVGRLDDAFEYIARCVQRNALFLFSTEAATDEGFRLRSSGRYTHSRDYVRACLAQSGFSEPSVRAFDLRKQNGQWLKGDLYTALRVDPEDNTPTGSLTT